MSSKRHIMLGFVVVVAACGGADATSESTTDAPPVSSAAPTVTTTSAAPAPTTAPGTTAPGTTAPPTSVATTSTTQVPASGEVASVSVPVGPGGIEYAGGGDELERDGPSLVAIDPQGGVHLFDPGGLRILSFTDDGDTAIDLLAIDILGVTAIAADADALVVVEIFFGPVRHRVHRISFDGAVQETIELPPGFRLEDGLSGVAVPAPGEIVLAYQGGAQYARWNGSSFEMVTSIDVAGATVASQSPDLAVDGGVITADLTGPLGGLRYLGRADDGVHVVVREDVIATAPAFVVLATVEWYSPALELVGSARIPLEDQSISAPPGIAMNRTGRVFALMAYEDRVELIELVPQPGRITEE